MPDALVTLDHVEKSFLTNGRDVRAVDDVSLNLGERDVLCLVGESGSGKTTTGKILAGLLAPTRGEVRYRGRDVRSLRGADWRAYRLGVQLVHQDPFASLNPTQRVAQILTAPLRRHRLVRSGTELSARLGELLEAVDLRPVGDVLAKYPHQLSGGQRQRVAIARALTVRPSVIVADEAVSMVDVSIRVSLLDTLRRLRQDMGLAVLFITHDLALARYFAKEGRVGVMYLGRLVEVGPAPVLVSAPQHPYTRALLAAAPSAPGVSRARELAPVDHGEWREVGGRPAGCPYHPRCPLMEPGRCDVDVPALVPLRTGTLAACHPVARALALDAAGVSSLTETNPLPVERKRASRWRDGDPAALVGWRPSGSGMGTRAAKGGPDGE